jgi:hypothetical protein
VNKSRTVKTSYRKKPAPPALIQQFAAVLANVKALQKTKGESFTYLQIAEIGNAVRDQLLTRGLLLVPSDKNWFFDAWMQDGRVVTQCGVETVFELTDGRRSLRWIAYGMGQDVDGYATAIAQTMALKSFLKRVGLIFGERDDPEREQGPRPDIAKPKFPREVSKIFEFQQRALRAAAHECGWQDEQAEIFLSGKLQRPVTIADVAACPEKQFNFAMSLLYGQRDLTKDVAASVEIVKQRKAKKADAIPGSKDQPTIPSGKPQIVEGKAQPVVEILDEAKNVDGGGAA